MTSAVLKRLQEVHLNQYQVTTGYSEPFVGNDNVTGGNFGKNPSSCQMCRSDTFPSQSLGSISQKIRKSKINRKCDFQAFDWLKFTLTTDLRLTTFCEIDPWTPMLPFHLVPHQLIFQRCQNVCTRTMSTIVLREVGLSI